MAPVDDRIDDPRVAAQRGGHRECHTVVQLGGFRDQTRKVSCHMPARREHEWMHDDRGRPLFDAAGEPLRDCGVCNLHVSGFHDAPSAEALLHPRGNFIEQRVGFGAPTAVIDQENRAAPIGVSSVCVGVAHREYLDLGFAGVKKRWGDAWPL